ncbi:MFS transporter [Streptomyces cynarae]|uniref:MFS transporter n=1 Tax=Streptomyces cynarae TaxID=2981134 RepID=A0ABY6EGA3_9ACTN|nr:MFS transporter [Streptomyces cynarae]UXY24821.1 MFS transporter [Streptomyces cynarae]
MKRVSRPRDGRRLGRRAAFAILVCANVVMMATASAPSPIYPLYRERWGLSVTMLTVVFAVYVVGLLGALLTVGSLSDHLGRRLVLAAALLVAAASTAIFWTAEGVVSLLIARVVQGIATGTATGGLAAGLVDLSPERRPHLGPTMTAVGTSIGMATGAGGVGLLVQSTSRPDAYVFPVLTLTFVVLAAVILRIPETLAPRAFRLASLRPRVRVPREARPTFLASVPGLVAGWAVTGLFLALTPSLVSNVLHVRSGAAGGLSIAALFLANSVGGFWSVRHKARLATLLGAVLLTLGASGLAVAIAVVSPAVYVGGSVVAGLGVGLTFNGSLRAISAVTTAKSRSEVFSAVYVISYAALSLPSLAAGLAAPSWGLETTGYLYVGFVGALALAAALHAGRSRVHGPTGDPMRTGWESGPHSERTRC